MIEYEIKKAKIMIVDDQEINTLVLEKILRRHGFDQCQVYQDSRLVESAYLEWQPDLLLLDLMMPNLNGFEVVEALKRLIPPNEFFPIVILTADITSETKQRAFSEGAMDFLTKPFDVSDVILRISTLLQMRALHQQVQLLNAQFEQKVQERTQELTEQLQKIQALLSES